MFNKTKREEKRRQKELTKKQIQQEKLNREQTYIKERRKNAFNLLSQILQNPYFQNVIVSELRHESPSDYSDGGEFLVLRKKDGDNCCLTNKTRGHECEDGYAIFCDLNLYRVYEAMTLISYGILEGVLTTNLKVDFFMGNYSCEWQEYVYSKCKGFDFLITPNEFSTLTNDMLIYYNNLLDCILSNEYTAYFGFLEAFSPTQKYDEQKQKIEMIIKERNLKTLKQPKREAGMIGEQEVEYALKWLPSEYIVLEKREGITLQLQLYNDSIRQEIDHIVVGPSGVILIETKNYSGKITIDKNGNWRRETEKGEIGEKNPLQQIERHHYITEKILGEDVPIHDIICIANDSSIIEGTENSVVPIIKSDMLAHYIKKMERYKEMTNEKAQNIIKKIEKARI